MRSQCLFILFFFTFGSFKLFPAIDNFQNYIEYRMDATSNIPIYLYEPSAEQENDNTDITKIFYRSESLSNNNIYNLVDEILSGIGDVVCVQNILSDEEAYTLYLGIKKSYAYFLYIPPGKTLDSSEIESSKGLLMASKYTIRLPQFFTFKEETNVNEGFLDFVIENRGEFLGHIYATNLTKNNCEEKIEQIKDKIQDDMSENDMAFMPFLLFGALNNGQPSCELETDLDEYFSLSQEGPNSILLVRDITFFRKAGSTSSKVDCSQNVLKSGNKVIIKNLSNQMRSSKNKQNGSLEKDFKVISHKSCDVNQNNQSEGPNGSLEGGFKYSWGDKDGSEFNAFVRGEIHDDHGNYAQGKIEIDNQGAGNLEVYGGHSSDKENHK